MHNRHDRASAVTFDDEWWHHQTGIEVALITGLVVIIILATFPLAAGGVQAVISSLADELMDAGNAINEVNAPSRHGRGPIGRHDVQHHRGAEGNERGAAAVELALLLFPLLMLMLGIVEFGRVYSFQLRLQQAARFGC